MTAIFLLPLLAAVFFGRAFCGGVCPLGAIQELVVLGPVEVPRRLDQALGLLKYVYLGPAIWFAVQPAISRDFLICRFDPFAGLFRRTGFAHMLITGEAFLAAGMFIGRPYCRYLCLYGQGQETIHRTSLRGERGRRHYRVRWDSAGRLNRGPSAGAARRQAPRGTPGENQA